MEGPPPAPLLGASLIVRDEAPALPRCLAALAGLVDEIVVHDTGSTDGTVALAREAGAVLVESVWRDDFAAARNLALEHGRSTWVLSVDADEVAVADAAALRRLLASGPPRDGFSVQIDNLGGTADGVGYSHTGPRLFRRDAARWQGRVHEQLVRADAGPAGVRPSPEPLPDRWPADPLPLGALPAALLRLEHHGYADRDVVRVKAERNAHLLRLALGERAPSAGSAAGLLLDLGRTLVTTGALQEAVDALEQVRELAPGTPEWEQATDFLARVLLGAGEDAVVLVLCDQLEQAGVDLRYCNWLRAQALAQLGDAAAAFELLGGIDRLVDPAGREHPLAKVRQMRRLVAQLAGLT